MRRLFPAAAAEVSSSSLLLLLLLSPPRLRVPSDSGCGLRVTRDGGAASTAFCCSSPALPPGATAESALGTEFSGQFAGPSSPLSLILPSSLALLLLLLRAVVVAVAIAPAALFLVLPPAAPPSRGTWLPSGALVAATRAPRPMVLDDVSMLFAALGVTEELPGFCCCCKAWRLELLALSSASNAARRLSLSCRSRSRSSA